MRNTSGHIRNNLDWLLLGLFLVLCLMGWLNIYAASFNEEHPSLFDFSQHYGKQMVWIITAVVLGFALLLTDVRVFEGLAYPIYGFMMLLLILVLLVGTEIKGARSWFVIGGAISIQPSEFAKFATALAVSRYLSSINVRISDIRPRLITLGLLAMPAVLIILQPDPGSALVYGSFLLVMYREGMSGNILLAGVAAAFLFIITLVLKQAEILLPFTETEVNGKYVLILCLFAIGVVGFFLLRSYSKTIWRVILGITLVASAYVWSVDYVFDNVFKERHQNRINELLGIISDPKGTGYNQHQSKIAIGSGGWFGKGYLEGTQTKFNFVPEQNTDFIFCTVGEEWGFAGSLIVIGLFVLLLIRIVVVAERQRSAFARIYGYCVASIFFFHFTINIAMTVGLAPVIGIPLPFFSYGGSSLWAFTILLFILIRLDSERKYVLR